MIQLYIIQIRIHLHLIALTFINKFYQLIRLIIRSVYKSYLLKKIFYFLNHYENKILLLVDIHPNYSDVLFNNGLIFFAAEDEGRTEDPTEQKKQQEREKGRVAKSQEIPGALVVLGGMTMLFFLSGYILEGLASIMKSYVGGFASLPTINHSIIMNLLVHIVKEVAFLVVPVFLIVMLMGIIGNVVQVGFLFTLKPLAFDFSRIKLDFKSMMKKVFISKQVATTLVKTIVKVSLMALAAYFIISADFLVVMKNGSIGVAEGLRNLGYIGFKLTMILTFVLLLMSIPDYIYQKHEFIESIKMTKQEVKQEHKETEGDPLIKQRQRQKAMEMLRNNIFGNVKEADVVITNPTHFAVALRYDTLKENAPRVLAKGQDNIALNMKNIAKNHNIPIIENKPLARELFSTLEVNDLIPSELFQAIVNIYMNVESLREKFLQAS